MNHPESATVCRLTSCPQPAASDNPAASQIRQSTYPATSPISTGRRLRNPRTKHINTMTTASTINAIGQQAEALVIALGARLKPMTTIIGPVTTGGNSFFIRSAPISFTRSARITYINPAKIIPPCALGISCCVNITACSAVINAKLEPRKTGTMPLVQRWNINVPIPAQRRATEGFVPTMDGTSTVAPNIANTCCTPMTKCRGVRGGLSILTFSFPMLVRP